MYPNWELRRLAAHKVALRRGIALSRTRCVEAAARVAQPLEWLDRMLAFWRKLPPIARFAAVPLGLLATRTVFPRLKFIGSLARWGPLAFGAARGIGAAIGNRFGADRS